jgi:geranylgeranyl diphosphate synthase type II
MAPFSLELWLAQTKDSCERALQRWLTPLRPQTPARLFEAMEYSLLAGGKRLRPALVRAAAEAVGSLPAGSSDLVVDFSCAVEIIHTYSLIHDDLPAMDDDDLRRGRPTNHKVFGEAMAILAGDALLTEAFALLARGKEPSRARLCAMLAAAAGAGGMVGGQADDVGAEAPRTVEALEALHRRKTGALIAVSCAGGALAAGASEPSVEALESYGRHLGLAFQICDDLMDLCGDPAKTGKTQGSDARKGKITFPSLLGNEASLQRARGEVARAKAAIEAFLPAAAPLIGLADFAIERDR